MTSKKRFCWCTVSYVHIKLKKSAFKAETGFWRFKSFLKYKHSDPNTIQFNTQMALVSDFCCRATQRESNACEL